jgi:hypothetical protein
MQYELLTHRGMQPVQNMPLRTLLYVYSKYRKEREESAGKSLL